MTTLSPVLYMVVGEVEFFRFDPEVAGPLGIISERSLQQCLQWNAHIFNKEIVKFSVGRVSPASQLANVVKSPYFAWDPLFRPFFTRLDHLQDQILAVNFLGQVVDATVPFFKERMFEVN